MISKPFSRVNNPFEGESERVSQGNACHDPAQKGCISSNAVEIHLHESGLLTGWCWSCSTWYPPEEVENIEGVNGGELSPDIVCEYQSDRYVESRMKEVSGFPMRMGGFRGIDARTARYANCKMSGNRHYGTMNAVLYEYYSREDLDEGIRSELTGWKNRILPKTMFTIGTTKGSKLYLQRQAEDLENRGYLVVTEGEECCLSALMSLYIHTGKWCRVVSLPTGGNIRGLINNEDFVRSHDKLIFWTDNDETGLRNLEQAKEYFGSMVIPIVSQSGKDVNDMLLDEGSEMIYLTIKEALHV